MILFRRFSTFFSLLVIGGLFELLLWQPGWYYGIIILLEATVVVILFGLTRGKIESREIWPFLLPPFFLIGSSFIFLFFVEGLLYKHLFVLLIVFLWWIFIENIFLFFHQPVRYQPYALENISAYLNLVTVFFIGSSFHSFILFLGFSSSLLTLFIFIAIFFLVMQMIWINNLSARHNLFLIGILALLISELFWVTKFLPSGYLANGIILAIGYYFLTGIVRHWILKSLDRQVVKRYLWISGLSLLVIVITARWT